MKKTLKSIDLNLISETILSVLVLLMGVIIMIFKSFGLIEIVLYGSIIFFIYASLTTLFYFIGRKEGDYELLLLSLINIIVATFMYIFKEDNPPMILGAAMTMYTVLLIANRGVKIITLRRENSYIWIIKFIVTFLIGFLGMLTTINLFNEVTVQTMMFGFYFISLGFMLTIENILEIFITDDTFKKILSKILDDEPTKNLEKITEEKIVEENITEKSIKIKEPKVVGEVVKKTTVKKAEKPKKTTTKEVTKKTEKVIAPKKTNPTKKETTAKATTKTAATKKETKKSEPKPTIKKSTAKTETLKKVGRPKKVIEEAPKKKAGRPKKTEK